MKDYSIIVLSRHLDYSIIVLSRHLASTKKVRLRQNHTLLFKTLASFLQENQLTTRPLISGTGELTPDFRILRSDLTDKGFDLIKVAMHKWINGVSAGLWLPTDDSFLVRELEKLSCLNEPSDFAE